MDDRQGARNIEKDELKAIKYLLNRLIPDVPYLLCTTEKNNMNVITNMPIDSQLDVASYIRKKLEKYQ